MRYTPASCFDTFPFPFDKRSLEEVGQRYSAQRSNVTRDTKQGLTDTYNRFHDPDDSSADIRKLRDLHVEMDQAVATSYGWTDLATARMKAKFNRCRNAMCF